MSFNIGMIVPISYQYRRKVFTKFIDPKQKEWTNKHNNIYSNHVGFIEISKCMEKHNGSPLRRQGPFCLPFNIHSREFEAMTKQMGGFFQGIEGKRAFFKPNRLVAFIDKYNIVFYSHSPVYCAQYIQTNTKYISRKFSKFRTQNEIDVYLYGIFFQCHSFSSGA